MNKFDDLFNDFFNPKKKDQVNDEISKIINAIQDFKTNRMLDENFGNLMEQELGDPTIVEEYIEDGFLFRKLVWETEHGKFVKIIVSEAPDSIGKNTKKKVKLPSLQEQLDAAVEIEDFEKAIVLRDQIAKKKRI